MEIDKTDVTRVGGTVLFITRDSIGVGAADGTIYWTEGNIGVDFSQFKLGMIVDVYYKKASMRKYPVVVWVEKQPLEHRVYVEAKPAEEKTIEQIWLSDQDRDAMLDTIENPPEPNDRLKKLMGKFKKSTRRK